MNFIFCVNSDFQYDLIPKNIHKVIKVIIIKVIILPGAHLPNRDMASRHSTGYSLLIGQELVLEHEYAGEVRHMQ